MSFPYLISVWLFLLFFRLDMSNGIIHADQNIGKQENIQDACRIPYFWSGRRNVTIGVPTTPSSSPIFPLLEVTEIMERTFQLYSPYIQRINSTLEECGDLSLCTAPPEERGKYGVVINWHGCYSHYPLLDYTEQISKVVQVAEDRNYYVITPLGTTSTNHDIGWRADGIPSCGSNGVDDYAFFESILDFIDTKICADTSKIYTIGFSNGAFLSHAIGCRYANRLAGLAADAGSMTRQFGDICKNDFDGAIPVQSFHSLSDPVCPYNGTQTWLSQDEVNAIWRHRNGCKKEDEKNFEYSFISETTVCKRWNCPLAPVEICALKDMDHCWYGGRSGGFPFCEPRRGDVDATNHMFDFWEEQSDKRKKEKAESIQRSFSNKLRGNDKNIAGL